MSDLDTNWREQGRAHLDALAEWVQRGETRGWREDDPEPIDPRAELAEAVLDEVRRCQDEPSGLRERLPPAFAPFADGLDDRARTVRCMHVLGGELYATVGDPFQHHASGRFSAERAALGEDIWVSASTHDGALLALAEARDVRVLDTDSGQFFDLPWPTGTEGVGKRHRGVSLFQCSPPTELRVFPDGRRVAVATTSGAFLLAEKGSWRLSPSREAVAACLDAGEPVTVSAAHVALHPSGQAVVVPEGARHVVISSDGRRLAELGPFGEGEAGLASFSPDGAHLLLHLTQDLQGLTVLLDARAALAGRVEEATALGAPSRIFSVAWDADGPLVGDANGYVQAWNRDGSYRWRHFLGGSVTGLALGEGVLYAGTAAGSVHALGLNAGGDPWAIGDSPCRERWRWLVWRGEDGPLRW